MDALPALRFAERWAEFTKAFAIYPSANVRVRRTLETMLETLPDAVHSIRAGAADELEICFFRNALHVDGDEIELRDGTGLRWLHDRIHRAALAGVAFRPGLDEESLLAFTEHLLSLYGMNDTTTPFQELWTESYTGIRLIDRRFRGSFGAEQSEADARMASWGENGTVVIDTARDLDVAGRIGKHPEIRDALAAFEEKVRARTESDEVTFEVDVLSRILRQMPGDVMQDEARVVRIVEAALGRLGDRLGDMPSVRSDAVTSDSEILQLMFEASQGLLGRADDGQEHLVPEVEERMDAPADPRVPSEPRPRSAAAHARRDAEIQDDDDAFRAELAALPPASTVTLTAEIVGDLAEQAGVFLHFLYDDEGEEFHPFAERALVQLLAKSGPEEMNVLRQYLAPTSGADGASGRVRIEDALRRNRVGTTLRERGLLTWTGVLDTFPREFGFYLESLDPESPDDMAELDQAAESLGVQRIREARDALLEEERILDPGRIDPLLAVGTRSTLPLLRLVLEQGSSTQRQRGIGVLRRMYKDKDFACLLFVFDTPEQIPVWYARGLTDPRSYRDLDGKTRAQITHALVDFVRETAGESRRADRRSYALQNIAHFMNPEATLFLEELLRAKTWGLVPKESKGIRQMARQILKEHKKRMRT